MDRYSIELEVAAEVPRILRSRRAEPRCGHRFGANTAVFSVANAMLFRPLPYPDADRIVMLRAVSPSRGLFNERAAGANFLDWQKAARSFEAMAAYRWSLTCGVAFAIESRHALLEGGSGLSSKWAFTMIAISAAAAIALSALGQNRPYDQVMKEVGPTYANLKKNLDANAFPAAVQDATKLESLFKEAENFWTPFKTKDALDFAKNAQALAQTASAAARDNNGQKAQGAYNALGKACKGCHDSHREAMPDKSFKIKP